MSASAPRVLFDDDPEQHDRLAVRPGDFAALRQGLDARPPSAQQPLLIRLHLQNFWKLPLLIAAAGRMLGLSLPQRPALIVDDPLALPAKLEQHLEQLDADLAGSALRIDRSDHVPATVLNALAARAAARPEERTHLLRLLGVLTDATFIGPLTFHLDLSNLCNTDCVFCGLHSPLLQPGDRALRGRRLTPGWETSRLDGRLFDGLIADLVAIHGGEDVLFSGEGEPLTHPEFARMLKAAKAVGLHLTVFSNGLLLDEPTARLLVDQGVELLYWSLSAGNAAGFKKVQPSQPHGAFERVSANVARLLRLRRDSGRDKPRVVLAQVLIKDNAADCLAVFELAQRMGVEIVRYQLAHCCGPGFERLLPGPDELRVAAGQIARARELAADAGITVLSNVELQLEAAQRSLKQGLAADRWSAELAQQAGCLAGWFFSRAFSDGGISFCCHDKIVGDLNAERFDELWFSERLRRVRRAARLFEPGLYNPDLSVGAAGGPLIGPDCAACGNYEAIGRAYADLRELGLWPIVERERSEARRYRQLLKGGTDARLLDTSGRF